MKHSNTSLWLLKWLFLMTLPASFASCKLSYAQVNKEGSGEIIHLADPTIFFHEGVYYLYGTGTANKGFLVYTSTDRKKWEGPKGVQEGFALRKEDAFGERGFWAPQVFLNNNKFYMAYTANEHIAIAESHSPLGPFTQREKQPLDAPVKQIDPFVFIDDDDKKYLYHVRLKEGNRLFVAEMTNDFSAIKPETLQECITAEEEWENVEDAKWSIAEGPSILKQNQQYYLVYSANHFKSPDYAVGYAISNSPFGPWEKYKRNPILSRAQLGKPGTGHGDFFQNEDGDLFYVFHTHQSDSAVGSRKTAVIRAHFSEPNPETSGNDQLHMDENTFYYLKK